MKQTKAKEATVVTWEPSLKNDSAFSGNKVVNDFDSFKRMRGCIIANC